MQHLTIADQPVARIGPLASKCRSRAVLFGDHRRGGTAPVGSSGALTKPTMLPWLAGLLPDGMALLANDRELMLELGDFERCVAWALLS